MTQRDVDPVVCPTCATVIDRHERCPAQRGLGQCQDRAGHRGWHWFDLGREKLFIWTGCFARRSCPERLGENDRWCVRDPGHTDAHNDGRGTTWVPEETTEAS